MGEPSVTAVRRNRNPLLSGVSAKKARAVDRTGRAKGTTRTRDSRQNDYLDTLQNPYSIGSVKTILPDA